jgi:hypothetical protein
MPVAALRKPLKLIKKFSTRLWKNKLNPGCRHLLAKPATRQLNSELFCGGFVTRFAGVRPLDPGSANFLSMINQAHGECAPAESAYGDQSQ